MLLLTLLEHESIEADLHKTFLCDIARNLFLTIHEQIESMFQSILCTSFHKFRYLGPLLGPFQLEDILKKLSVFLKGPWTFLDTGIKKAVPVFPALFRCPKDFYLRVVFLIEFLGDGLPVNSGVLSYNY